MDTLAAIRTYGQRNPDAIRTPRTGTDARYFDGFLPADQRPTGRPLREIAAEQGAMLRRLQDGVPAKPLTPARQAAKERAERVVAGRTPVTAPIAHATDPADRRAMFAKLNAMANALPEGMYALPRRADAGEGQSTYFFKIFKTRKGNRIVGLTGGVGRFVEHPLNTRYQEVALTKIAADVRGCAARFGHETGTCGRCGSPLTNDKSRAMGLGPHCAKQF